MNWYAKLEAWGYPRASELAPILEELELNPEAYGWDPITNFLNWLLEQIKPYLVDVGLIGLGAIITLLAGGWYRAIGLIPMGYGIYDIMKRVGAI